MSEGEREREREETLYRISTWNRMEGGEIYLLDNNLKHFFFILPHLTTFLFY